MDVSVLPNAVGRLDDVVEAIREGDRLKAGKLLQDEFSRLYNKVASIDADLEKAMKMKSEVRDFMHEAMFYDDKWIEARKACGWSGVDGVDGPADTLPLASREQMLKHADAENEIQGGLTAGYQPAPDDDDDFDSHENPEICFMCSHSPCKCEEVEDQPALKAEHLPDGTKFILGGDEYERRHATRANGWIRTSPLDGVLSWCYFSRESIQELIDRGVRFEIPEGGA